jgi:hypothetical protein
VQTLAVDLMYFYPTLSEAALRVVTHISLTTFFPTFLATRALDVASRRASVALPAAFLSMLLSTLAGRGAHVGPHGDWTRHLAVVTAACRALTQQQASGTSLMTGFPLRGRSCPCFCFVFSVHGKVQTQYERCGLLRGTWKHPRQD